MCFYKRLALIVVTLAACGKKPETLSHTSAAAVAITPAQLARNNPAHQDKFLPKHEGIQSVPEPYRPGPSWGAHSNEKFAEVRVKIFPHNSSHTQPQGPEGSSASLAFVTTGKCEMHSATASSSAAPMGAKLKDVPSGKMLLTAEKLAKPFWLVCEQSVRLERKKEKIQPLSYIGKLFVKKVSPAKGPAYLTVVDVLSLEDYVKGVVPSEMPFSWHIEALKAQAVAARTYALYNLAVNVAAGDAAIQREQSGAQLDDTVEYQAFMGVSSEGPLSNQAVAATRGQVLTYQGAIIDAFFHSDSGGHTEDAVNVWGTAIPYALGKPEIFPYAMVKEGTWTLNAKLGKLQARLAALGELSASVLTGVAVLPEDQNASGRAFNVTLESGAGAQKVRGRKFQNALGLHSNFITPVMSGDTVKVQGRGYGHGVGMSQWGARIMADHYRKNYEEILKHYYTDVEITPLRK